MNHNKPLLPQVRRTMVIALAHMAARTDPVRATLLGMSNKSANVTLRRMEAQGLVKAAGTQPTGRRPVGLWKITKRGRLVLKLVAMWERA